VCCFSTAALPPSDFVCRASAMMGTAPMTERQLFEVYVEYLVMCYIDPEYRATAAASEQHRAQYGKAIKKIEFELAAAREAVHSEAWRSCTLGLLEAVETLPGADSEWNPDAGEYTNWREIGEGRCDACNRGK